eukprot:1138990-Pelagomonas_calceolata.AAC.1
MLVPHFLVWWHMGGEGLGAVAAAHMCRQPSMQKVIVANISSISASVCGEGGWVVRDFVRLLLLACPGNPFCKNIK